MWQKVGSTVCKFLVEYFIFMSSWLKVRRQTGSILDFQLERQFKGAYLTSSPTIQNHSTSIYKTDIYNNIAKSLEILK